MSDAEAGQAGEGRIETLGGRRLLFVMAVGHEYGPHLRRLFSPLFCGVGPIEAAASVSARLGGLRREEALPDLVVSLGSAGSRRVKLGEVRQVASVAWRDMDASALGFPRGVTPFLDHPPAIPLPTPIPGLATATLSTGADIVAGERYAAIEADLVDMESFAILRACQRFGVPMMGLRGVSDGPGTLGGMSGWTALLHLLDERLARAIEALAQALPAGLQARP